MTDADESPDHSACAREPIHVPGHIQPHGVLVAACAATRMVVQVSGNFTASTGLDVTAVLGADLDMFLGPEAAEALDAALASECYAPLNVLELVLPLPLRPLRKVIVHRHLNRVILELEDGSLRNESAIYLSKALAIIVKLRGSETVAGLCDAAAREVRQLVGFDRVMVYRFDTEGHGAVISEDKRPDLAPYLGLRYPASDIPEQARRLYILQRVRAIPDIDYEPVPLVALEDAHGDAILDMTYCSLRGVSPMHREYLSNMGVKATLAVSLLQDGVLWGMIVCHHTTVRTPAPEARAACDVVGQLLSVLLTKVSDAEELGRRHHVQQTISSLRTGIEKASSVAEGLLRNQDALLDLVGAGGALVSFGGVTSLVGRTPPAGVATRMVEALRLKHGETVVAIADAGTAGGIAERHADAASGILVLPLSNNSGDTVAWFRPEVVKTIEWGGNPRRPIDVDPSTGRLSPRKSFAAWSERVRGQSEPWGEAALYAAKELRRAIAQAMLRQAEARLAELSSYDPLTGLPNRRVLEAELERWGPRSVPTKACLLFLDVDRFKTINDSLGHAAGDEILTQLAARLLSVAPPGSVPSRLGGDEFVLFLPGAGLDEAEVIARDLIEEFTRPFTLRGQSHHVSASVGIASSAICGPDLMRAADSAMYAAKREGGGKAVVFAPELHARALSDMQTEQDLFTALERDELELHYQPIVSVPDRRVRGFEALIRWRHPKRGWVPPAQFIALAEKSGLIRSIGEWVLRGAVRQAAIWRRIDPKLTISVNVSAVQLTGGSLCATLAGLLEREKVLPDALCVEITESALMNKDAVKELHNFRALGVTVSIDDFGTGYSSLSYLQGLPVDLMKIDKSFISPLGSGGRAENLFRAIVALAHTLGIGTVAEGCETEEQWKAIEASGCAAVQGWLIAKAMDPMTAGRFLKKSMPGTVMARQRSKRA
jgi:diguanylate cyclase (GGDEF)-like protein